MSFLPIAFTTKYRKDNHLNGSLQCQGLTIRFSVDFLLIAPDIWLISPLRFQTVILYFVILRMEIWCGTIKNEAVQRALYELWWLICAILVFCFVAAKWWQSSFRYFESKGKGPKDEHDSYFAFSPSPRKNKDTGNWFLDVCIRSECKRYFAATAKVVNKDYFRICYSHAKAKLRNSYYMLYLSFFVISLRRQKVAQTKIWYFLLFDFSPLPRTNVNLHSIEVSIWISLFRCEWRKG